MTRCKVVLIPEPDAGGYSVTVPALPGLFTQGDSKAEALEAPAAARAIAVHLKCLAAEGRAIPGDETIVFERVEVATP